MRVRFLRDPALFIAQAISLLTALILLLPLTETVSAAAIGIVTAIGGAVVAFVVAKDGQVAALVGIGRAVIYFAVVLGAPISEVYQGLLIAAFEQLISFLVRFSVTAPVDANLQRVPRTPAVPFAA